MDQILAKIFRYIPEWLFVLILIVAATGLVFLDNPMTTVCDTQIADFASGQNGKLFPRAVQVLDPLTGGPHFENTLNKSRDSCIYSLKGAGCYSYFKIVQGVLNDFKKLNKECLLKLSEKPIIIKLFSDYTATMTQLAWGERPPTTQLNKKGWLSDTEIKTFCQVRKYYNIFYPPAQWDNLSRYTLSKLVIDPNKVPEVNNTKQQEFSESVEVDKEFVFEKAPMDFKKAYDLSLLSYDCLYYQ